MPPSASLLKGEPNEEESRDRAVGFHFQEVGIVTNRAKNPVGKNVTMWRTSDTQPSLPSLTPFCWFRIVRRHGEALLVGRGLRGRATRVRPRQRLSLGIHGACVLPSNDSNVQGNGG